MATSDCNSLGLSFTEWTYLKMEKWIFNIKKLLKLFMHNHQDHSNTAMNNVPMNNKYLKFIIIECN